MGMHFAHCKPTARGRSVEKTLTSFCVKKIRKSKTCCMKAANSIHDTHSGLPRLRCGAVERLLGDLRLLALALARDVVLSSAAAAIDVALSEAAAAI